MPLEHIGRIGSGTGCGVAMGSTASGVYIGSFLLLAFVKWHQSTKPANEFAAFLAAIRGVLHLSFLAGQLRPWSQSSLHGGHDLAAGGVV